jgi:hypothetical protein
MSKYIRTTIKTFEDLSARQRMHVLEQIGEDAREDNFVTDPTTEHGAIPLSMFQKSSGKIWDGFYGLSYFSGYFIKFDKTQEIVTVGYRHW